MAYYLTGDCHGNFKKLILFCRNHETNQNDVMIILGDVELNYYLDKTDKKKKKSLAKMPITFLCVHGNHEERPFNIPTYKLKEWKGGQVYYEEDYPNILFAKDGEIYDFEGKSVIVLGGAYSVDKDYRQMVGLPWFCDEQPSVKIKEYAEKQLEKCNWTIDFVLTHACPFKYEPTDLFLDFIDQSKVDKSTEEWLAKLEEKMKYRKWYFGHYHENRKYVNAEMLFDEIKELSEEDSFSEIIMI